MRRPILLSASVAFVLVMAGGSALALGGVRALVEAHKSTAICVLCFLDGLALVAILGVDAERAEISAPCVAVVSG